jgi:hypothetical protein
MTIEVKGTGVKFGVRAVNEGSIPPNTATVTFSDVSTGNATQASEIKSGQQTDMNITYGGQ